MEIGRTNEISTYFHSDQSNAPTCLGLLACRHVSGSLMSPTLSISIADILIVILIYNFRLYYLRTSLINIGANCVSVFLLFFSNTGKRASSRKKGDF